MGKLYIMCGHGAGDPGACAAGQTEEERVRYLASRIKVLGGDQVIVLDASRNWFVDNGINSLSIPKGDMLLELHRDSASESARGAHVIIYSGFDADSFDKALAEGLSQILPGRSEIIKKRSDLANPKRAAARGINYRLAEVGFITNAQDREIFDTRTDEIASIILKAAGIEVDSMTDEPTQPSVPIASGVPSTGGGKVYYFGQVCRGKTGTAVRMFQCVANIRFGYSLAIDGSCGSATEKAIREIQAKLGLEQDGSCGPATWTAILAG